METERKKQGGKEKLTRNRKAEAEDEVIGRRRER
jgi:hypothetical protein